MTEWLEVVLPISTFVLGAVWSTWQHHRADARALRRQEAADRALLGRFRVAREDNLAARHRELEALRPALDGGAITRVFEFDRATLVELQDALLELHQAVLSRVGVSGHESRTETVLDDMRLLNRVRLLAARSTNDDVRRATGRYDQQAEATLLAPGHDGGATLVAFQRAFTKANTTIGEALNADLHRL
jgi:hypothetical protein